MRNFVIFIFLLLVSYNVFAQEHKTDSIIKDNINSYFNVVKSNAVIFTGKEEPVYGYKTSNHPYLNSMEFRKGELYYKGRVYPDVMLRLNHDIEEITVMNIDRSLSIIIPKNRLDYAIIDSLLILYQKPESADGLVLPEGYYVRIYNGNYQVWKRETCYLNTRIIDYVIEHFFEKNLRIYIYKDGIYNPVRSKRSVLKLFASKKKDLKKFIKQAGLNFNSSPDKAIYEVTKYYEEIN